MLGQCTEPEWHFIAINILKPRSRTCPRAPKENPDQRQQKVLHFPNQTRTRGNEMLGFPTHTPSGNVNSVPIFPMLFIVLYIVHNQPTRSSSRKGLVAKTNVCIRKTTGTGTSAGKVNVRLSQVLAVVVYTGFVRNRVKRGKSPAQILANRTRGC